MERPNDNVEQKMMLPPLPGTFTDREELITYVRNFGVDQGYVVTIKKSRRDSRVILGCDRGGAYRNRRTSEEPKRKRKASSRLINCPFEAIGKKDDDVWVLKIKNGEHNHEPLKDMSEHPYSRRFTEEEARLIKEMTEAGAKPRQVLETLKKSNPMLQSTPRHLYNLKAKIRQGKFSERSFKSWRPSVSTPAGRTAEGASSDRNQDLQLCNFIGGKYVESQGNIFVDVVNPATQEVVSQVPSTTYEEFKAAVNAAKQAFRSWKNTPISTRQRIMFKLQELIRRDIDEIALSISVEQGTTLKASHTDILRGLEVVEHACATTSLQMGEFVPNTCSGIDTYSIREPLGVCAGIWHFNSPAMVPLWMFPIAVICGNTFVLKPSEKNPGASMKLAALAMEAGLPDGVLNIVHGGYDVVNHICDDDDIKAISIVGSYTAVMNIYAKAAAKGKCIQAHMGSKNHAVVLPDACMETTLDALVSAGFGSAGEQCMSLNSVIFVGHSTPWEEELVKRAKALKVNGGPDARADLGPVVNREVKDMICSSVQSAVISGAKLILDGRNIMVPRYEKGNFLGPTMLSGITTDMECYKEDLFGPVLLCTQVSSLEEAITIINSHKFVTGASIFTTSGVAARKFQNVVEAGLVGINVPVPIPLPFYSTGLAATNAGNLNFSGKTGIQFYTKVKIVAQQWKEQPTRGIISTKNLTSDRDTSNQSILMASSSSSDTDVSGHETSPSVPATSETEMIYQVRPLNTPPIGIDPSSSEASTALSAMPELNLPNQGSENTSRGPERNYTPLITQINEVATLGSQVTHIAAFPASEVHYMPVPLPTHENDDPDPLLQRHDIAISPDYRRVCMPIFRNADYTSQKSDDILHSTEGVYLPASSHRTNDAEASSLRTDSFRYPLSERSYGFGRIGLHLNADSVLMMSSQENPNPRSNVGRVEAMFQSERAQIVAPTSERMYIPTTSSTRNENMGLSSQKSCILQPTEERVYMSTSSQRAYDQDIS